MFPQGRQGASSIRKRDGWAVEYRIEDNGCGMDAETKEKIFRTFFSTKGSKGTGLGLMIAQKIVGEHGGSIQMESEQGSGTRFVVRLPAGDRSASVTGIRIED